ncbi:MAG: hypothetical protein GF419_09995 [Ignavibacteriales bacterium]|nr:hypothetical protein [Ignavibacteriales bacterium]
MRTFLVFFVVVSFVATAQTSVVYRNYVKNADGNYCEETRPDAAFMVYLNGDLDRVLLDNAPRWEDDADANIKGDGATSIELGNFHDPALQAGDETTTLFVDASAGEYATHSATVTMIPWIRPPETITLSSADVPARPANAALAVGATDRTLTWDAVAGVNYDVYRRPKFDPTPDGKPSRKVYERVESGNTTGTYVDVSPLAEGAAYVVVPVKAGVRGVYSEEALDYAEAPKGVEAIAVSDAPYEIAVSWMDVAVAERYFVYRGDSATFEPNASNKIAETIQSRLLDDGVSAGTDFYYRVAGVAGSGVTGLPSNAVRAIAEVRYDGVPDLNVEYISRHPKYDRFYVDYDPPGFDPEPQPGTENDKHWPDDGELMTYIAHLHNSGGGVVDSMKIEWFVDGALQRTDEHGPFFPRERKLSYFQLPWSFDEPSAITCKVTPYGGVTEISSQNNEWTQSTRGFSFDTATDEEMVLRMEEWQNKLGSYGFVDYQKYHVVLLNQMFADAVYPETSPEGVPMEIFIDTIRYVATGALASGFAGASWADGGWALWGSDQWYADAVVARAALGYDAGLVHEWCHQLGLIDLYQFDVHGDRFNVTEPRTGERVDYEPEVHWSNPLLFYTTEGNDVMHDPGEMRFSEHSAGGLLKHLGMRRGYYGWYLYSFAADYTMAFVKPDGTPLADYDVAIYQGDWEFRNPAKFEGSTNADGEFIVPKNAESDWNGGMYCRNPFSSPPSPNPHVVGRNGTLFIRVAKGDSVGYAFTDICPFNNEYYRGDTVMGEVETTIERWKIIPDVGVEEEDRGALPEEYRLYDAYPNPFNPSATIAYDIKAESRVRLEVFTALGERVETLAAETKPAGTYRASFRPRGASGAYIIRLQAEATEGNERHVGVTKAMYIK